MLYDTGHPYLYILQNIPLKSVNPVTGELRGQIMAQFILSEGEHQFLSLV